MRTQRDFIISSAAARAAVVFCSAFPVFGLAQAIAQETPQVLYTSPSGNVRIEQNGEDVWVTSSVNSAERAKLPIESIESLPDEFHSSPNEEWLFGLHHVGSCLRNGDLFHRSGAAKIDVFQSFNELAWKNCVTLGAMKSNFSAEGFCAMNEFDCWSMDSARLLIELRGGEDKREMQERHLYFNTRTKAFEITDYLRKLIKTKSEMLACAEPVDPLPSEAELKTRLDKLDQQLNTTYGEIIAKTQKDRTSLVREAQRAWIKHRDEGAKFYVSLFPQAERERRRLQFMSDVTAARIEVPAEEWEP